ncbi:MAG: peptidase C39 family protein, partial [Mycetocola sp.]
GAEAEPESEAESTRRAETELWQAAHNHPACEPVGLGVAVQRLVPDISVDVVMDTDTPVLLEMFSPDEAAWRAELQRASRVEASRTGLPIDQSTLTIGQLRTHMAGGARFLALIMLDRLMGIGAPHWVLCHSAGDGFVVVDDPWISTVIGDSWVDSHLMPLTEDEFDAMWVMPDGRSRAALRLRAVTDPGSVAD